MIDAMTNAIRDCLMGRGINDSGGMMSRALAKAALVALEGMLDRYDSPQAFVDVLFLEAANAAQADSRRP